MFPSFNRLFILAHRWLGIVLGLLMLLWFVSGLVMLFVARPQLSDQEASQLSATLQPAAVRHAPLTAWQRLGRAGLPDEVRLEAPLSTAAPAEPAYYRFRQQDQWFSVRADNAMPATPLSARQAGDLIGRLINRPLDQPSTSTLSPSRRHTGAPQIDSITLVSVDQWTLGRHYAPWRPYYRVSLSDGQDWYVSRDHHRVMLHTTTGERAWNWLGSVIHWLYFTPLREQAGLWRQLILWLSAACALLVASGLWLGWQRWRWRKPYRSGRSTPYPRRSQRWHHLWGLGLGMVCLTWLISGWLSLGPWALTDGSSLPAARQLLHAGHLDGALLAQRASLPAGVQTIRWQMLAGHTQLHYRLRDGRQWLAQPEASHATSEQQAKPWSSAALAHHIQQQLASLHPQASSRLELLQQPDERYYALRHQPRQFPVWRLSFDDARQHRYYLAVDDGRLLLASDRGDWVRRWLYHGLHRLDFPPLLYPAWLRDTLVIGLSLAGLVICLTGVLLGWRRLRRRPAPCSSPSSQAMAPN